MTDERPRIEQRHVRRLGVLLGVVPELRSGPAGHGASLERMFEVYLG
jgi:hypothetical protein